MGMPVKWTLGILVEIFKGSVISGIAVAIES